MLVQGYLRLWKLRQTLARVLERRNPGAPHLPQQENTRQQVGYSDAHGGSPGVGEVQSLPGLGDL